MFEAKYSLAALAAVIPVNGCSELDPAYTSNSCRGDHGVSAKFQKSSKGITVTEYDGNKKLVYKGIGIASTTQEAAEQIADFCTRGSTPASYLLPPDSGPVSESRDQNTNVTFCW